MQWFFWRFSKRFLLIKQSGNFFRIANVINERSAKWSPISLSNFTIICERRYFTGSFLLSHFLSSEAERLVDTLLSWHSEVEKLKTLVITRKANIFQIYFNGQQKQFKWVFWWFSWPWIISFPLITTKERKGSKEKEVCGLYLSVNRLSFEKFNFKIICAYYCNLVIRYTIRYVHLRKVFNI